MPRPNLRHISEELSCHELNSRCGTLKASSGALLPEMKQLSDLYSMSSSVDPDAWLIKDLETETIATRRMSNLRDNPRYSMNVSMKDLVREAVPVTPPMQRAQSSRRNRYDFGSDVPVIKKEMENEIEQLKREWSKLPSEPNIKKSSSKFKSNKPNGLENFFLTMAANLNEEELDDSQSLWSIQRSSIKTAPASSTPSKMSKKKEKKTPLIEKALPDALPVESGFFSTMAANLNEEELDEEQSLRSMQRSIKTAPASSTPSKKSKQKKEKTPLTEKALPDALPVESRSNSSSRSKTTMNTNESFEHASASSLAPLSDEEDTLSQAKKSASSRVISSRSSSTSRSRLRGSSLRSSSTSRSRLRESSLRSASRLSNEELESDEIDPLECIGGEVSWKTRTKQNRTPVET